MPTYKRKVKYDNVDETKPTVMASSNATKRLYKGSKVDEEAAKAVGKKSGVTNWNKKLKGYSGGG